MPAAAAVGLILAGLLWAGLAATLGSGHDGQPGGASPAAVKRQAARAYGQLPLRFESNRGQTDSRVDFMARGAGYTLFLTPRETVLSLTKTADSGRTIGAAVRMRMVGANPHPKPVAGSRLPGVSNYLTGRDRGDWHTGLPGFQNVRYEKVYPGTDVVYYGKQGKLEYDFVLAPGADPRPIAIDFAGARGLRIDRSGDLLVNTRAGVVRQPKPRVYQRVGAAKRKVAGRYALDGHRVRFRIGAYDRGRELVIDPKLSYATFLGGDRGEVATGIAIDPACSSACSAYITGTTDSLRFPTKSAFQGTNGAGSVNTLTDAFVTKLNADGSALEYSTYLGSGANDEGYDIAVDSGRAFVVGWTTGDTPGTGQEFPTTAGAFQATKQGSNDGFLSVLSANGSALDYSTFLGGTSIDRASGVAAAGGKAYVTGFTNSDGFPTSVGAYDRVCGTAAVPCAGNSNRTDAFVAKLDPSASGAASLVYSTFLGGSGAEGSFVSNHPDIALASGAAYVTGVTTSADFPVTPGAFQTTLRGTSDAFVAKLKPDGSDRDYATYLGGGGAESNTAIAADSSGATYVTGGTTSADFPASPGAFQTTLKGPSDAFVAKLKPDGSDRNYATYLGGTGSELGGHIAVNEGRAFVVGDTGSADFPVKEPVTSEGGFVTELDAQGAATVYSTHLGPGGRPSVAVDSSDSAYVAGGTFDLFSGNGSDFSEFPSTPGSFQPSFGGGAFLGGDAFVAKLSPVSPLAPYVTAVSPQGGPNIGGTTVTITGTGFTGVTAVQFGAVPARSFRVESDGLITAVSPRHPSGEPAITVTAPGGTSPANPIARFTYGEGRFRDTAAASGQPIALKDGRVLALSNSAAQLYDPKTEAWTPTNAPSRRHGRFSATLLPDGRVLMVGDPDACCGGSAPADTAELYDPATGNWRSTANPPAAAREAHTATLLWGPACEASPAAGYCGKVLVAGGKSYDLDQDDGVAVSSSELYDPKTDTWSSAGSLGTARSDHTATLLAGTRCTGASPPGWCGKVLVVGGSGPSPLDSAELYDPKTNSWSATESLPVARSGHVAAGLLDGTVLIPGTDLTGGVTRLSLLYHPDAGSWTAAPTPPFALGIAGGGVAALPNGKALFLGFSPHYAHLFDSALRSGAGDWVLAGRRNPASAGRSAVVLSADPIADDLDPSAVGSAACGANCGKVLIASGELYTPAPSVRSIAPASGPGGTTVTITGTGFTHGVTEVRFGGTPAASFTVDSYSKITAISPPAPGGTSVPIAVVNEGAEAVSANSFTYGDASGPAPGTETGTGPPAAPAPGPTRDTTPPVISRLSAIPPAFTIGSLLPRLARAPRVGTTIRFSLSERAAVTLSFARRVGRHYRTARPSVRISARAGANRVRFQGRLSRLRKLRSGRYRLTAIATDAAGNRSNPKRTLLTVMRRSRRG